MKTVSILKPGVAWALLLGLFAVGCRPARVKEVKDLSNSTPPLWPFYFRQL